MTNITNILLRSNYTIIPPSSSMPIYGADIASIMMNLSYYGYALNVGAYEALAKLDHNDLVLWWKLIESELKENSGESRNIGDFVVYKNFPEEVLEKSEAEYWIPQILMYWGFPSTYFTQEVKARENLDKQPRTTVLRRATKDTIENVLNSLLCSPARWKDQELEDVLVLVKQYPADISKLSFKENLIKLATTMMRTEK